MRSSVFPYYFNAFLGDWAITEYFYMKLKLKTYSLDSLKNVSAFEGIFEYCNSISTF